MIDRAKEGDMAAVRLCVDRICPRLMERPAGFALPPLARRADAPRAMAAIAQALGEGELTAAEAADLGRFVAAFVHAHEQAETELQPRADRLRDGSGKAADPPGDPEHKQDSAKH